MRLKINKYTTLVAIIVSSLAISQSASGRDSFFKKLGGDIAHVAEKVGNKTGITKVADDGSQLATDVVEGKPASQIAETAESTVKAAVTAPAQTSVAKSIDNTTIKSASDLAHGNVVGAADAISSGAKPLVDKTKQIATNEVDQFDSVHNFENTMSQQNKALDFNIQNTANMVKQDVNLAKNTSYDLAHAKNAKDVASDLAHVGKSVTTNSTSNIHSDISHAITNPANLNNMTNPITATALNDTIGPTTPYSKPVGIGINNILNDQEQAAKATANTVAKSAADLIDKDAGKKIDNNFKSLGQSLKSDSKNASVNAKYIGIYKTQQQIDNTNHLLGTDIEHLANKDRWNANNIRNTDNQIAQEKSHLSKTQSEIRANNTKLTGIKSSVAKQQAQLAKEKHELSALENNQAPKTSTTSKTTSNMHLSHSNAPEISTDSTSNTGKLAQEKATLKQEEKELRKLEKGKQTSFGKGTSTIDYKASAKPSEKDNMHQKPHLSPQDQKDERTTSNENMANAIAPSGL